MKWKRLDVGARALLSAAQLHTALFFLWISHLVLTAGVVRKRTWSELLQMQFVSGAGRQDSDSLSSWHTETLTHDKTSYLEMAMNSDFSHDTYLFCLFFYASTLFTACPHTPTGLSFVQMFQKALISPSVWFCKRTSANKRSFLTQDCKYSTLSSLKSAPLKWWGGFFLFKNGRFFLSAPFQHTFLNISLSHIVQ